MKFPTGGDRQLKSATRANGRFGENPKPTVKSGWKKSDVLEYLCPEYFYAQGFFVLEIIGEYKRVHKIFQSNP